MNPYNGFILSMIVLLPLVRSAHVPDRACQPMRLEIKVAQSQEKGSTIKLTAPGDARLRVFLMPKDGLDVPAEVSPVNGELRNVAPGTYEIIVQDLDKRYCSELKEITVD